MSNNLPTLVPSHIYSASLNQVSRYGMECSRTFSIILGDISPIFASLECSMEVAGFLSKCNALGVLESGIPIAAVIKIGPPFKRAYSRGSVFDSFMRDNNHIVKQCHCDRLLCMCSLSTAFVSSCMRWFSCGIQSEIISGVNAFISYIKWCNNIKTCTVAQELNVRT